MFVSRIEKIIAQTKHFINLLFYPYKLIDNDFFRTNVRLKENNKISTTANVREEISPFLSHIRFLSMTTEDFVQNVVVSDVLLPEETVFILKNIAKPNNILTNRPETMDSIFQLSQNREMRLPLIIKVFYFTSYFYYLSSK